MRLKDLIGWVILAFIFVCQAPTGVALALIALYYATEDRRDE